MKLSGDALQKPPVCLALEVGFSLQGWAQQSDCPMQLYLHRGYHWKSNNQKSSLVYLQSQERSVFVPTTLPSKSTTVCQQGIEHWGFPKIWKTARITAMFHRNSQATHQHHNDSLSEPRNLLCSKRWILQLPKTSRRNLGMFDQEHHPKISVTRHHHAPTSIRERRQLGSRCYTKPCAWFHHHCGWKKSD